MNYKVSALLLMIIALTSCSTMKPTDPSFERAPAAEDNCVDLTKSFFLKENYQSDLEKALIDKKLITFTNKFVTIQHPRMDWLNRARNSLNQSIKNWNNNKYPAFYIFNDEDIVTHAKNYYKTLDSIVSADVPVAKEATANLEIVTGWTKSFENYQRDINNLLEERISLQYNLSLLKKLKLKKDEVRDIKLTIKRDGKFVEEIITVRKSDKDVDYQIKRFKEQIKEMDGTLFKNGKIKERVIRQAMLKDILTILQREFEYAIKNAPAPHPELTNELERINMLLKISAFNPTTYGVYRITNKVFLRELAALSKLDVAYKKFVETPVLKFKEVIDAFIHNRPLKGEVNPTEPEKMGIFKKVYTKITNITPKQAATGAGVAAIAGLGAQRYFTVGKGEINQLPDQTVEEISDPAEEQQVREANSVDSTSAHEEQVKRSEEIHARESEGHSQVIEVHVDELTNP